MTTAQISAASRLSRATIPTGCFTVVSESDVAGGSSRMPTVRRPVHVGARIDVAD